jgi:hypothetical protein
MAQKKRNTISISLIGFCLILLFGIPVSNHKKNNRHQYFGNAGDDDLEHSSPDRSLRVQVEWDSISVILLISNSLHYIVFQKFAARNLLLLHLIKNLDPKFCDCVGICFE